MTIIKSKFTAAEHRLWLYLTSLDPFGDQYVELPDTLTILEICDLSKSTFYLAISKFQELKFFDFQDKGFSFRNRMVNSEISESCPKNRKVFRNLGKSSEKSESESEKSESTIYTEVQTSLSEYSESEGENFFEDHTHIQTQPKSLARETEVLMAAPVNPKGLGEEKISVAAEISEISMNAGSQISTVATVAIAAPPVKPIPKPKAPGTPKITDWLPEGPWKIKGGLDMNFRDWLAQCWVTEFGGYIEKRKSDVLAHFKKDPNNLPIAWERYNNEFFHRYQTAQILLNNGIEIKGEDQERLIANQRAITAELPPEISPLAITPIPEIQAILQPGQKTLSSSPVEISQETEMGHNRQALATTTTAPSVRTEDGRILQYWKPPVIEERPATPEQAAEMQEKITKLAGKFSFGKSPSRDETPCNPVEVVESTEEAIALEAIAKEEAYFQKLNIWVSDPILRPEAMKAVMNSSKYECVFDEEGNACQVIRTEPQSFFCED